MPTVQRFGRCRIEMYFGDHRPPHYERVAVAIESLAVRAGSADPRDIAEALAWVANHRRELLAIWMKLSEENE